MKILSLLLPALLPSWRFFDWIAPSPRIEYRLSSKGKWLKYNAPYIPTNPLKRLFWNPQWNDYLFLMSCVERYAQNPTDHSYNEILKRLYDLNPDITEFRLMFVTRNKRQVISS